MTELAYSWIEFFEENGDDLFLSNENGSWTYSELAKSAQRFRTAFDDLDVGTCLIEGDYSLNSIACLMVALTYDWNVVPVTSDNDQIVSSRSRISGATHRVSEKTGWKLESIIGESSSNQVSGPEGAGVILFSSGTTGEPKAMLKPLDIDLSISLNKKNKPVTMALLLLFDHIGGLNTLLSGLKKSAHLVAPLERTPNVLSELIQTHAVKVLPCSPTFLNMMYMERVFEDFNLTSLRLVTYGTERMPEDLLRRLSIQLPRTKFLQTFGTSETGIVQTKSLSSSSTVMTIDDPAVEWKIVEKELWLRTSGQIMEYLNTDQQVTHDGWFKTGDLVEMHDERYFKIVGRKTEMINVGGEKVLPAEIEDLLMTIPVVIDCTAYAVPNSITGQSVGVRVVPEQGSDTKVLKKLVRELCRSNLERYKIPSKVIFDSGLKHTDRFKKER